MELALAREANAVRRQRIRILFEKNRTVLVYCLHSAVGGGLELRFYVFDSLLQPLQR
jgi:hypothetical protein